LHFQGSNRCQLREIARFVGQDRNVLRDGTEVSADDPRLSD
jgi:hypothetical protein